MKTNADRLYELILRFIDQARPLPSVEGLKDALRLGEKGYKTAVREMAERYGVHFQTRAGEGMQQRRAVLPDGRATRWQRGTEKTHFAGRSQAVPVPRVTMTERALIDAAVAAGRVRRVAPVYQTQDNEPYRRPTPAPPPRMRGLL